MWAFELVRLRPGAALEKGSTMDNDKIMEMFQTTGALLNGHFELRSGLHSDQYFQCAHVLAYPHMARELCRELVSRMCERMGRRPEVDGVISPAIGGIIVGHEVAFELGEPAVFAEKSDGVLKMRRFKIDKGEKYIVAEDVITKGGRVRETIDIVKDAGGIVEAVCVLVDRSREKIDFGVPSYSLLNITPSVYEPGNCPLCSEAIPLTHPGS